MTTISQRWSWTVLLLLCAGIVCLLWLDWERSNQELLVRHLDRPIIIEKTKPGKVETVYVDRVVEIKVPTPRREREIEESFGVELGIVDGEPDAGPGEVDLLGTWDIPPARHGGEVAVFLEDEVVETRFRPDPDNFFQAWGTREYGLSAVWNTDEDLMTEVYLRQRFLRMGRVHLSGEIRGRGGRGLEIEAVVSLGLDH